MIKRYRLSDDHFVEDPKGLYCFARDVAPVEERLKTLDHWREEVGKRQSNLEVAYDRIFDMLMADDGEAWHQAERLLKERAPHLYEKLGSMRK